MSVAQTDFVVYCFSFLIMKPLITNDALCNDAACSQFRTLPPGSWRAPGDVIISHLCSARCLGFLCGSASCLRLQPSSTSPCPGLPDWRLSVHRRRPCQTTVFCRHSKIHSLSVGRTAVLETGPLPPQDHKSGRNSLPPNLSLCGLS